MYLGRFRKINQVEKCVEMIDTLKSKPSQHVPISNNRARVKVSVIFSFG